MNTHYEARVIRCEAMRYTGANWEEVARWLGLNVPNVWDGTDSELLNVFPSESYRTTWLAVPKDLKAPQAGEHWTASVELGAPWVIVHSDGRKTEVMSDYEFRRRWRERPVRAS